MSKAWEEEIPEDNKVTWEDTRRRLGEEEAAGGDGAGVAPRRINWKGEGAGGGDVFMTPRRRARPDSGRGRVMRCDDIHEADRILRAGSQLGVLCTPADGPMLTRDRHTEDAEDTEEDLRVLRVGVVNDAQHGLLADGVSDLAKRGKWRR